MEQNREELLKHLAASLKDTQKTEQNPEGGAILLVGAGISVSAGIPPAQQLMKIAIENFPNYFTSKEHRLAQENLNQLQYNDIMTKLSPIHRKEIFNWHIQGHEKKNIPKAKLNFAHLAIAELLKQGYIKRILTTNFDPLLINACYMVGMYPLPAIYDIGSVNQINPELFDDPCIIYLNGQHAGQVQRNTSSQLNKHDPILQKVVVSTGCKRPWIVAGYSGENDPLMVSLNELRPYNNWIYWLEYSDQVLQRESHQFLEDDEECKVIYKCDADESFMDIAERLNCSLDFIEQPEKELNQYKNLIHFYTAKNKEQHFLEILDKNIELLRQKELANETINLFHDFLERLDNENLSEENTLLKIKCYERIIKLNRDKDISSYEQLISLIHQYCLFIERDGNEEKISGFLFEYQYLVNELDDLHLDHMVFEHYTYLLTHLCLSGAKHKYITKLKKISEKYDSRIPWYLKLRILSILENSDKFKEVLSHIKFQNTDDEEFLADTLKLPSIKKFMQKFSIESSL